MLFSRCVYDIKMVWYNCVHKNIAKSYNDQCNDTTKITFFEVESLFNGINAFQSYFYGSSFSILFFIYWNFSMPDYYRCCVLFCAERYYITGIGFSFFSQK